MTPPIDVSRAFDRDWRKVKDERLRSRFIEAIDKLDPVSQSGEDIRPLTGAAPGWYRMRVGDWRIVFWVVSKDDGDHIALSRLVPRGELDQVAKRLRDVAPETTRGWND